MDNPLVSIIVPAYNAEGTIADCVASILSQTYTEIEAVVVDDGSCDGTAQLVAELQLRDCRVRLVRQENAGVSAARNAGLAASQGEWVSFVDSDDLIPERAIETLIGLALGNGASISAGAMSFDTVGPDGVVRAGSVRVYEPVHNCVDIRNEFEGLYAANYVQSACAKLFSTALLNDAGIRFDEGLDSFEDFAFVMDCLRVSPYVGVSRDVCYRYLRKLDGTGSTRFKPDMAYQMTNIANRVTGFYGDVLLRPWSEDCMCHIAQFFIVVVNNIQKSTLSHGEACELLAEASKVPVFARMLDEAVAFPNTYSRAVCRLVGKGHFGMALLVASFRNYVRSRHAA